MQCAVRSLYHLRACQMSLLVKTAIRGYCVYISGSVGAACQRIFYVMHKNGYNHDRHALAMYGDGDPKVSVGHLPHGILKTCHYFTWHKGKTLTGHCGRLDASVSWYPSEIARALVPWHLKATLLNSC